MTTARGLIIGALCLAAGSPALMIASQSARPAAPAPARAASKPADAAREPFDYALIAKIREEGLLRSRVMDHVSWLADVYGPRITASPSYKQASEWTRKRLTEWGLANVHEESFPFGKGWSVVRFSAHLVEPQAQPIIGNPRGWSPSTRGIVTADVMQAVLRSESDLEKYRGRLRGKIVLTQPARIVKMLEGPVALRMTEKDLAEATRLPIPPPNPGRSSGPGRAEQWEQRVQEFLVSEGVVAALDRDRDEFMVNATENPLDGLVQRTDGGTVFISRLARPEADHSKLVPTATIAVEHYNRMVRILDKGLPVKVELNIQTEYHDAGASDGASIIAEMPGTDLAHEVVMIGGHFDSQYGGTGATDNAAGCAATMEALRILKTVGARPRRTIRLALWGGEELGHLGSRFYAAEHFADVATMALKPEHKTLSGYFNVDNGAGRIRGVWLQGNLGVAPIFEQWIQPLKDLGMTTLSARAVGGTDHQAFAEIGLPGFQFMQDRLEYNSRSHHSNMDVVDRVQPDDLAQIATVVAVFAYNAAMRDERLPRVALPAAAKTSTSPSAQAR